MDPRSTPNAIRSTEVDEQLVLSRPPSHCKTPLLVTDLDDDFDDDPDNDNLIAWATETFGPPVEEFVITVTETYEGSELVSRTERSTEKGSDAGELTVSTANAISTGGQPVDDALAVATATNIATYLRVAELVAADHVWPGPAAIQACMDPVPEQRFDGIQDIALMSMVLEDQHDFIAWVGSTHGILLTRPNAAEVTQAVAEYLLSAAPNELS